MKITFIGGGIMAEAMIAGITDAKLDAGITVSEPVEARRASLRERFPSISLAESNADAVKGAGVVVISVKPQQFEAVAKEISGVFDSSQTVVSIMAGVRLHSIGLKLNHERIVRIMPNTPMQVRKGISAWTAAPSVPAEVVEFVRSMLAALGDELKFSDEKYVDMATALSGSGPGYVFMFIESLTDAGVAIGLPVHVARHLATQTVLGSAELAKQSGKHPAELKNMVTSPGGTTAAGLRSLEQTGVRTSVIEGVLAAYERGEELGSTGK